MTHPNQSLRCRHVYLTALWVMLDLLQRFHRPQPGRDIVQSQLQTGTETQTPTHSQILRLLIVIKKKKPTCCFLTPNHICKSLIGENKVETMHANTPTNAHMRTHLSAGLWCICARVCVSAVYPQRPGSPEHSPVREQHREDLWLWPGQRHIQRPRLRQERQCTASSHSLRFRVKLPGLLSISIHCGETLNSCFFPFFYHPHND